MFITILAATPRSGSATPPAGTAGGGETGRATTTAGGATAVVDTGAGTGVASGAGTLVATPVPFEPCPAAGAEGIVTVGETARTGPVGDPLPVEKYACQLSETEVGLSVHLARISSTSQAFGPRASSSGLRAFTRPRLPPGRFHETERAHATRVE